MNATVKQKPELCNKKSKIRKNWFIIDVVIEEDTTMDTCWKRFFSHCMCFESHTATHNVDPAVQSGVKYTYRIPVSQRAAGIHRGVTQETWIESATFGMC